MMHGHEKSDPAIVAMKPANKTEAAAAERSAVDAIVAESVEPRAGTKGNVDQQSTCRTQSRVSVSQALDRIRKVARETKEEGEVHRAFPPRQHRVARRGVLRIEGGCCAGRGSADMEGLRGKPRT
jgi:hypothetical protein